MDDLGHVPIGAWSAFAAFVAALVHLVAHRRVDLGGLVVAVVTASWLLDPQLAPAQAAWMGAAVVVSTLAWWRGAAAGCGRPEVTGLSLATAAIAAAATVTLPAWTSLAADQVRTGALGPVVVVGLVGVWFALERRGLKGQRTYHYREIPVDTGEGT